MMRYRKDISKRRNPTDCNLHVKQHRNTVVENYFYKPENSYLPASENYFKELV